MPRFDSTGPANAGPMTGRGRGYCIVPVSHEVDDSREPSLWGARLRCLGGGRSGLGSLGRCRRGRRAR